MHGATRTGPGSETGAAEKQKQPFSRDRRGVPQTCTTVPRRVSGTYTLVAGRSYL